MALASNKNYIDKYLTKALDENNVKVLTRTCPKHPNIHLISINGDNPVCPVEMQNKLNQQSNIQATNFYFQNRQELKRRHYNYIYGALDNKSILTDKTIKHASFKNFITYTPLLKKYKIEALNIAKNLATPNNVPHNLIIAGQAGKGKSHLAMSILKYVNTHANPKISGNNPMCLFIDINELLRRIKFSFKNPNLPSEEDYIRLLSSVYLLVIDDLGAEFVHDSNFPQTVLYEVLSSRQGKRTIFTTNLSDQGLKHRYPPHTLSRILDGVKGHSHDHVIKIDGRVPDARTHIVR